MSKLADYWKATTDKDAVIKTLPVPAHVGRCRVKACRCTKANARECFADRQRTPNLGNRACGCECHSH